jgi:hypothetical protein
VDADRLLYDGHDLLGMDGFFLKEMEIRDPFFHVQYSEELWGMLRDRYLAFAAGEIENIIFVRSLLSILADRKPFVNHPRVYEHRNLLPYHVDALARGGLAVSPFVAGAGSDGLPLRMDEYRVWDCLSFPKGKEREWRIRYENGEGSSYRVIVVGDRPLGHAVAMPPDPDGGCAAPHDDHPLGAGPPRIDGGRVVTTAELPAGAADTALAAARTIGASFAVVDLRCGGGGDGIAVRQVDPSPEFFMLEDTYRLSIAEPLADHLIAAGSQSA